MALVVAHPGTALSRRPQVLAFAVDVVGHNRRRCFQDVLCGAVVLLQADRLRLGEVALKLQDVANVGPAPGIDGLILIADDANVLVLAAEQEHELVLRAVCILVFVNHQVLEAPIMTLADFASDFQQPHRLEQQIVEVEGVGLTQLLAINLIDMGNALGFGIGRLQINFLRIQHVVLRPGDASQHNARGKLLFVDPQPPYRCFHKLLLIALVVNGEIFSQTRSQRLNVTPQQPHAKRMKGRDQGLQQRASAHELQVLTGDPQGPAAGRDERDRPTHAAPPCAARW